jgi:RNA polymerase sigma factor (sigma-70 family)
MIQDKLDMKASDLKYREEISRIYKAHYSGLYRYGLKITGSAEMTKDAIQELFIQFLGDRKLLSSVKKLDSYLYRSIRNNLLREVRPAPGLPKTGPEDPELEFSHEELLINEETSSERRRIVAGCLNGLPPRQKEIIYLRFYNDLSYDGIAEVLGISYKTVKNLTYEAMNKMRVDVKS